MPLYGSRPPGSGDGSSGDGSRGDGSVFYLRSQPTLTTADITAATAIPVSGAGYEVTLVDALTITGGILADVDFVSEYLGTMHLDLDFVAGGGQVEFTLIFTHTYDVAGTEVTWPATRTVSYRVADREDLTLPLSVFNARSRVPLGDYTLRNGNTITITQAVLDGDVDISIQMRIQVFTPGAGSPDGTRKACAIRSLTWQQPQATFYQLGSRPANLVGLDSNAVNELIRGARRVMVPNLDGSFPAPEEGDILVTDTGLAYGHVQVNHATPPTVSGFTEVTDTNFAGVFDSSTRPDPSANNLRYIYNYGAGSWQRAGYDGFGGFGAWAWSNVPVPTFARPWRGYWDTEAAATSHIEAASDKVIYGNTLYSADDFTAGTSRTEVTSWQPVDEGVITPKITLLYWRDDTATPGTVPSDASSVEVEIGELIPLEIAAGASMDYFHFDLPRPYELGDVLIAGAVRFASFTERESTTRRTYDSAALNSGRRLAIVVQLAEGDD